MCVLRVDFKETRTESLSHSRPKPSKSTFICTGRQESRVYDTRRFKKKSTLPRTQRNGSSWWQKKSPTKAFLRGVMRQAVCSEPKSSNQDAPPPRPCSTVHPEPVPSDSLARVQRQYRTRTCMWYRLEVPNSAPTGSFKTGASSVGSARSRGANFRAPPAREDPAHEGQTTSIHLCSSPCGALVQGSAGVFSST